MPKIVHLIKPVNTVLRKNIDKFDNNDFMFIMERIVQIKHKLEEIEGRQ